MRDDFKARLRTAVQKNPRPTRPESRRRVVGVHAIAILVMLGIFEAAGGAAHGSGRPALLTIVVVAAVSLVGVAATFLATPSKGSMLERPWWVHLGLVLLAPVAITVAMTVWHHFYDEPFQRFGWRCMGLTIAMGIALGTAMFAVRRARVIHHPGSTGGALGATAGVWATMLVDVWCPLTNLPHVVVGHALPVLVLGLVGVLAGTKILALKSR
jgi:hypothetical protein